VKVEQPRKWGILKAFLEPTRKWEVGSSKKYAVINFY
jgi:hypothetical protein